MKAFLYLFLFCTACLQADSLISSALDSQDRRLLQEQAPRILYRIDREDPLSIFDIKTMARLGISNDKIIFAIHSTHSRYQLTPSEIEELEQAGLSSRVIRTMKKTAEQP